MERSLLNRYTDTVREKVLSLQEKLFSGRKSSRSLRAEGLTDYGCAELSLKQRASYYAAAAGALFFLGMLFYRSAAASLLLMVFSLPLEKVYRAALVEKRKRALTEGFKDVLYSVSGSIAAGRQMPSALELAAVTVSESFGAGSDISRELCYINSSYISSHADIGELLEDLGERSRVSEIKQFAMAYRTCQRSGGDLEDVCLRSAALLLDKLRFKSEADALVQQKKLDVLLLTCMPIAVLLLLNIVNYSYIAVFYETVKGRMVMSLCLLLIVSALLWGIRIVRLEL